MLVKEREIECVLIVSQTESQAKSCKSLLDIVMFRRGNGECRVLCAVR